MENNILEFIKDEFAENIYNINSIDAKITVGYIIYEEDCEQWCLYLYGDEWLTVPELKEVLEFMESL